MEEKKIIDSSDIKIEKVTKNTEKLLEVENSGITM